MKVKCDFGGYATKANVRCTDGRTIKPNSFEHQDGVTVPLVWQHQRNSPDNILGKAILENRSDGVYAYCTFNDTDNANTAKNLVSHGDITSLSIYANHLIQKGGDVVHGNINEVSLVLTGANSEAKIDKVYIEHSDEDGYKTYEEVEDEAIIRMGQALTHSVEYEDNKNQNGGDDQMSKPDLKEIKHEDSKTEKTAKEVFNSFSDEQKDLVYAMIGYVLDTDEEDNAEHDDDHDDSIDHNNEGGDTMHKNVFEGADKDKGTNVLSHEDQEAIIANARRCGSFREALSDAVLEHGITNIDYLFPEAKNVDKMPFMITRDQEWVSKVWNGARKSPFSRIRSVAANLSMDEARARGYIKGKKKVEEQFTLLKRSTTPQTVYKKQALDRDDIIDITDFDVVAWLKVEMRTMLNEELARAILVGDGRAESSDDKISEDHIRSIYHDNDMYSIHYTVDQSQTTAMARSNAIVDDAHRARKGYMGSGSMTFFTDNDTLSNLLLTRDNEGRRMYNTMTELASAMGVKEIVEVPVMSDLTRSVTIGEGSTAQTKVLQLIGIMVNMNDYTVGADKGGNVSMFDDFDIDYNKEKYLIEARCSGALQNPYSAVVLEKDVTPAAG